MPIGTLVMMRNVLMDQQRSYFLLLDLIIVNIVMILVCSCILLCCRISPLKTFFISCFWMDCLVSIARKLYIPMTIRLHFHYILSPGSIMGTCTMVYPLLNMLQEFRCWNFFPNPNRRFLMCNHARWKYWQVSNLCAWYAFHAYATMRLIFLSCIAKSNSLQKVRHLTHAHG